MFDVNRVAEILSKLYSEQLGYPVKITLEKKSENKNGKS